MWIGRIGSHLDTWLRSHSVHLQADATSLRRLSRCRHGRGPTTVALPLLVMDSDSEEILDIRTSLEERKSLELPPSPHETARRVRGELLHSQTCLYYPD